MLTLAYSTVEKNLDNLLAKTEPYIQENLELNFLVVCQILDESSSTIIKNKWNNLLCCENFTLVFSLDRGLSKSRNVAIQNCNSKYIWFLDDDVELNIININCLLKFLRLRKENVFLLKIGSLENHKLTYKNYSYRNFNFLFLSKLSLLKVSSIEIVCELDFLKKNNFNFNVNVGLGTSYPCSEENLFLIDCYERDATFKCIDLICVYHTTIQENRLAITEGHYVARGLVAQKYSFLFRWLLVFRWALRANSHVPFIKRLYLLLSQSGLVNGK